MTYLLDTDTCIAVLRRRPGYEQRLQQESPANCAVSMVTVFELFSGVEKASRSLEERQKVQRFISVIHQLPFERASAETAARVRMEWERSGQPIGPYDLLIAAQALTHGLTLVSNNVSEFQRVQGLHLQSWP